MKPSISSGPRGVLEVDWPFFGEICRALALKVAREFDPEVVLGVAKAGVIPGVVVASILQREFTSMVVTRKDEGEEPVLIAGPPSTIRGRRVLIVDETCDTGSTMKLALSEVRALKPATVKTRFLRARRRLQDALAPELSAALADSFAFAGGDCEALTERVVRAWCKDATP